MVDLQISHGAVGNQLQINMPATTKESEISACKLKTPRARGAIILGFTDNRVNISVDQ